MTRHIILSSHPSSGLGKHVPVQWGAADPQRRGPVIATMKDPAKRNAIGAHAGAYAIYRALAIAADQLNPLHVPDLTDTAPAEAVGPHPQWGEPGKIVS